MVMDRAKRDTGIGFETVRIQRAGPLSTMRPMSRRDCRAVRSSAFDRAVVDPARSRIIIASKANLATRGGSSARGTVAISA